MDHYDLHLMLLELKPDCKPNMWNCFMVKQQLYTELLYGEYGGVELGKSVPNSANKYSMFATSRGALLRWWEVTGGTFRFFYPSSFF
jgi:hypothetical protein